MLVCTNQELRSCLYFHVKWHCLGDVRKAMMTVNLSVNEVGCFCFPNKLCFFFNYYYFVFIYLLLQDQTLWSIFDINDLHQKMVLQFLWSPPCLIKPRITGLSATLFMQAVPVLITWWPGDDNTSSGTRGLRIVISFLAVIRDGDTSVTAGFFPKCQEYICSCSGLLFVLYVGCS